jgi:dihydropteroate synthase
MGILNITPDSFYAGSRAQEVNNIIEKAAKMINEGATILDIGGQSTRPGAEMLSAEAEWERVQPAIELIRLRFPEILISIDTFHASVAQKAVNAGADIVNDICAGLMDPDMASIVGTLNVPFIAMHMRGTPSTMQTQTQYDDLMNAILDYFTERINALQLAGIKDIILDPGFGFAKNINQNFTILSHLDYLQILERPVLAGLSRKSMIYKTLGITADEALNGTTALHTIALMKGAQILRVHDVKEAMECIRLTEKMKAALKVSA